MVRKRTRAKPQDGVVFIQIMLTKVPEREGL
jgi:hypothetical protein